MSEDRPFAPRSPLIRKPKRSYLFVWVLLGLIVGTALLVVSEPYVSVAVRRVAAVLYGLLLALMVVRQIWLVVRDLRSKRYRDKWFGRMLDRSTLDEWR